MVFDAGAKPIRAEHIQHGFYKIAIRYKDGKTLWLACLHVDAGMAKTIDVAVTREPDAENATVETTCTYRGQPPSVEYTGRAVIDETRESSPATAGTAP